MAMGLTVTNNGIVGASEGVDLKGYIVGGKLLLSRNICLVSGSAKLATGHI